MILKIITKLSKKDIFLAKKLFSKNLSNESLIARYEIYNTIKYIPKFNDNGEPIFENNIYWSISHKSNLVFIGTSNKPLGIDIEILKNRGKEVFTLHEKEEYNLFSKKNFESFYYLWTIKESIIKLHLSKLDMINNIKIFKTENTNYNLGNIFFNKKTYSLFENKKNITYSGKTGNIVYSFSYFG